MERILINDITKIRCASQVQMNSDGSYVAFVVTEPNREKNDYEHNLWLLNTESEKINQITFSGKDKVFLWDDEKTLLIPTGRKLEDVPQEPEEKTVFYRLSVEGGEARKAFKVKASVRKTEKVRDGLYCMTVLTDRYRPDPETTEKEICLEEKDYHVFEELPLWGNGRGFVAGKRTALFLYDEIENKLTRVTGEYTDVSEFQIKGDEIAYVSRTWNDVLSTTAEVTIYNIATGEKTVALEQGTMKVTHVAFSGDGLLITATDMEPWGTGQLCDFYRYDRKEKTLKKAQDHQDIYIGTDILFDCSMGSGIQWKAVDGDIYFAGLHNFSNEVYRFTKDNRIEKVISFEGGCISYFDTDGKKMYMIGNAENQCADLYQAEIGQIPAEPKRMTSLNDELLGDRYVAEAEYVPFTDSDGVKVDGWVLKPIGFDPDKTYPGVLEIHGGPRCTAGPVFFHEMQVLASMGYFVFFCNPRGSEGRGNEFADLRGKYGTIDYQDLMEFTDHVLSLYPQIDKNRIGAAGGSYGGFMCNWIEGHTDRFAAIASQRSVSNWVADFGASEIGVTFDKNEMAGATPWTDMEKMWEHSPLKYADKAKTPILFIHSLCDYNCTIDQGIEMFAAMKYFGVPSRMCVFEGENHELSRSGKPKHRIRRLNEITGWFEKYLK